MISKTKKITHLIDNALFRSLELSSSFDNSRNTIGPKPKSITFERIPITATRKPNVPKS